MPMQVPAENGGIRKCERFRAYGQLCGGRVRLSAAV